MKCRDKERENEGDEEEREDDLPLTMLVWTCCWTIAFLSTTPPMLGAGAS